MTERLPRHAMAPLGESESNGPSPERLRPKFGVLTISGRSGTGKTAVSEILAAKYGISPEKYIKTGQLIREIVGGNMVGYGKRDISVDKK